LAAAPAITDFIFVHGLGFCPRSAASPDAASGSGQWLARGDAGAVEDVLRIPDA
jgi:hypothetical protein